MNVPFRLYGIPGCAHCEAAAQFMFNEKVPTQLVVVGADPIAQEGIKKCLGGDAVQVPCLVSVVGEQPEIIVGFKEEDYKRVIGTFRAKFGAGAPSAPAYEGVNPGEASPSVVSPASPDSGAA